MIKKKEGMVGRKGEKMGWTGGRVRETMEKQDGKVTRKTERRDSTEERIEGGKEGEIDGGRGKGGRAIITSTK